MAMRKHPEPGLRRAIAAPTLSPYSRRCALYETSERLADSPRSARTASRSECREDLPEPRAPGAFAYTPMCFRENGQRLASTAEGEEEGSGTGSSWRPSVRRRSRSSSILMYRTSG